MQLPNPFITDPPADDTADPPADDHRFVLDEAAFMAAITELASERSPAFLADPRPEYLAATQDPRIDMRMLFALAKQFQPIFDLLRAA